MTKLIYMDRTIHYLDELGRKQELVDLINSSEGAIQKRYEKVKTFDYIIIDFKDE